MSMFSLVVLAPGSSAFSASLARSFAEGGNLEPSEDVLALFEVMSETRKSRQLKRGLDERKIRNAQKKVGNPQNEGRRI